MTEEFVVNDGVRIWTTVAGKGIPVLICMGGPGFGDYLGPVAEMIDDISRVIRFEARGCGRSDKKPPYSLETDIQDIEAIRKHYKIDRWIVGGHSWGANLSLAYSVTYPEKVNGLIYLAGTGVQHDIDWTEIRAKGMAEKGEKRPDAVKSGNEEVMAQVFQSWYNFIKTPDLLKKISKLDIPAIFVQCEYDVRPAWPLLQVANLMPRVQLKTMKAEHFMWLDQPEELKRLLREFIQGIHI